MPLHGESGAEYIQLPNSVENPAIDQFPKMEPLLELDGSEVRFELGEDNNKKEYVISSFVYNLYGDGSIAKTIGKRLVMGIWEVAPYDKEHRDEELVPASFIEYSVLGDNKTILSTSYFRSAFNHGALDLTNPKLEKFGDFMGSNMSLNFGMETAEDKQGRGLGTTLFTSSLVVLQKLGVNQVFISSDLTNGLYVEDLEISTEEPKIEQSSYAKYSVGAKSVKDSDTRDTVVSTTLSSMQLSILNQSFNQ